MELLRRLPARGVTATLLIHGRNEDAAMGAQARAAGAVVLGLKGLSSLRGWLACLRELTRQRPQVVICVNQSVALVPVVLRTLGLLRTRVICIFHTTQLEPADQARFFLFRWAAPKLDRLVYVGARQMSYWRDRGIRAQAVVIENGVDLARFDRSRVPDRNVRGELGLSGDDYVVGIVAALRPEKNHVEAVRAVGVAMRRGLRVKLMIVGDGPTRDLIQDTATQEGVSAHVLFAGLQTDVRPFVQACDVGLLCSYTETFPLVTLEMLALGVPMISSRVGAQVDLIDPDRNGRLYDSGDAEELASLMIELADPHVRRRLGRGARASVLPFGMEAMVDRYDLLLHELVET